MKYLLSSLLFLSLCLNAKTISTSLSFEQVGHVIISEQLVPSGIDLSYETNTHNYLDLTYQVELNFKSTNVRNLRSFPSIPSNPSLGSTVSITTEVDDGFIVYDVTVTWEFIKTEDGTTMWVAKSSERRFKKFSNNKIK